MLIFLHPRFTMNAVIITRKGLRCPMHFNPRPLHGTGLLLRFVLSALMFFAMAFALSTAASAEGLLPGFPGLEKEDLYYRQLLSEEPNGEALVQIFDDMYDSITGFNSSYTYVYGEGVSTEDVKAVYDLLMMEPAGVFTASNSASRSSKQYTLKFDYFSGIYKSNTKRKELIKASVALLADAGITSRNVGKLSDSEKVRRIHDALVNSVTYGSKATNGQSAYSAIVKKEGVCGGYARAMQFLLAECGVEALYVSGRANGGNHVWNLVKEDGNWYTVDVTWDDPANTDDISYDYFNISDELLLWDHEPAACDFGYPKAPENGWSPVPPLTGEVKLSQSGGKLKLTDLSIPKNSGKLYIMWVVNGKLASSWTGTANAAAEYNFAKDGSVKTLQLYVMAANSSRYIKSEVFVVR